MASSYYYEPMTWTRRTVSHVPGGVLMEIGYEYGGRGSAEEYVHRFFTDEEWEQIQSKQLFFYSEYNRHTGRRNVFLRNADNSVNKLVLNY
jgi:hypothetical protein